MKKEEKMTLRLPKKPSVDEFIWGAEKNLIDNIKQNFKLKKPWEDQNVRSDICKQLFIRVPEDFYLKIKHLAYIKDVSKQALCLDILKEQIDKMIEEMDKNF